MTHKEIHNRLLEYKGIDRIQLTRADYKGTNEGFNEKLIAIITELQSDFDFKYYETLNNLCMSLDSAEYKNDIMRIDNLKSQIKNHEKTINNSFLVYLRKDIEIYIHETKSKALDLSDTKEKEYTPRPCFNPESIKEIMTTLKTFFDASQHTELKRIIETGSYSNEKLLFRDNSNKLSDYFKILFEKNTITGCDKKDLINWIVKNFKYTYRKTQKDFIFKTVEKTISGDQNPCKNPIT